MEKILDNKKAKVVDVLQDRIQAGSKLSVISAYFTIYAFDKLREQLERVDSLRFLFVEPTFTKQKEEKREFVINRNERERFLSGTEFEIKLRNELTQSKIAKECAEWIRNKVEFRSMMKSDASQTRAIHVSNPKEEFVVQGSIDFTATGIGAVPSRKLDLNMFSNDPQATREVLTWFDEIWDNPALAEDVKDQVLQNIQNIYKENSPEFLYFVTLYNVFREYLEELTEENILKPRTGIKDTTVWNKLYKFQKDGVMGAIAKLEKHNGCIIADSVGLGKTFEGLAIIKYYELRNCRVLVLAPKKLRDNWTLYRVNDSRNILAQDRFGYDVLNHTDLSRTSGTSGDINLETVNWGNYDLVVIDESHNFRNNDPRKDRKTRYRKLMEDIIRSGVKTKVLMLSATPVNNRLNDLKNQIAFITEGDDNALKEDGIRSISDTLRSAQLAFNTWLKLPTEGRKMGNLLSSLNIDYFKLLDALTIARSRKHIEKYYDLTDVGKFPVRRKPINQKTDIDTEGNFPTFDDINDSIRRLKLALYSPFTYVRPDRIAYYEKKYDIQVQGGRSVFRQEDRERNLVNLMRVNILKRLESSVYSYDLTLQRIHGRIVGVLKQIDDIERTGEDEEQFNLDNVTQEEAVDDENLEPEDLMIGTTVKVAFKDLDLVRWRQDLVDDEKRLSGLITDSKQVKPKRDAKLERLKQVIQEKMVHPINPGNRKVVIFSAFADTTNYLYEHIAKWAKNEFGVESALVTGSGPNLSTASDIPHQFGAILTNFSPLSKERDKVYPNIKTNIDILIATDCVSEGQNLQDCDCLVNYDIHWNPVRIIQRFGRIDRIGSKNDSIQLINFWPNLELDAYIRLESRVRGRMMLLNSSATGEDDIINETETDIMNDIEYRKNQLMKLQEEVVDLEDISGNLSITDLTMNDFKMDLMEYMKDHKQELENAPLGMYAVADRTRMTDSELKPGAIFVLKQAAFSGLESKEVNALHPYYLICIEEGGIIRHGYTQAKYILDMYKKLCRGVEGVNADLVAAFDRTTNEASDMRLYSSLLETAIANIIGKKQENVLTSLFSLGRSLIAEQGRLSGLDDFELVSFLVIK